MWARIRKFFLDIEKRLKCKKATANISTTIYRLKLNISQITDQNTRSSLTATHATNPPKNPNPPSESNPNLHSKPKPKPSIKMSYTGPTK